MPYRIITSSGTIIAFKIMDFFSEPAWEVIDCCTKAGRERYAWLYGRPFPKKKRKSNQVLLKAGERQIPEFFREESQVILKYRSRASYDRHYNPAAPALLEPVNLPFTEQQAIQEQEGFGGYLYHLFACNNFDYFAKMQQRANVTIFSWNCQWDDIFRLEIARIRLGIPKLSTFLEFLEGWEELQVECGIDGKQIPSQAHYWRCLTVAGPETVQDFFHLLRGECVDYNLYGNKIDIWDGRFLDSYSTGQKRPKTGQPSDPEVGVYVHNRKYIGTGYLESRIIDSRFCLPKYYKLVNPQQNDNQTFQQTFGEMLAAGIEPAEVVLADGGPKAHASSIMVIEAGSIPLIAGPKNAAGHVIVTEKNRFFYARYVQREYWPILDSTYDKRTRVEQGFGLDSTTFNLFRIPYSGKALSTLFTGLLNCETLLTALTAVKTGQFNLIMCPSAFRKLGLAYQGVTLEYIHQLQNSPVTPLTW